MTQAHSTAPQLVFTALTRPLLQTISSTATEVANWVQQLSTGTSRHDVVDSFLHSQEAAVEMVDSYYAAFLHLPGSAVWGALGMGLVAVPLAVRWCTGW